MICPLCNGFKSIPSAKIDPQNVREYDECPACHGSGEVETEKTKKPIITIYKAHGVYSWEQEAQKVIDDNLGAWEALSMSGE